jgi:hypothetical protein
MEVGLVSALEVYHVLIQSLAWIGLGLVGLPLVMGLVLFCMISLTLIFAFPIRWLYLMGSNWLRFGKRMLQSNLVVEVCLLYRKFILYIRDPLANNYIRLSVFMSIIILIRCVYIYFEFPDKPLVAPEGELLELQLMWYSSRGAYVWNHALMWLSGLASGLLALTLFSAQKIHNEQSKSIQDEKDLKLNLRVLDALKSELEILNKKTFVVSIKKTKLSNMLFKHDLNESEFLERLSNWYNIPVIVISLKHDYAFRLDLNFMCNSLYFKNPYFKDAVGVDPKELTDCEYNITAMLYVEALSELNARVDLETTIVKVVRIYKKYYEAVVEIERLSVNESYLLRQHPIKNKSMRFIIENLFGSDDYSKVVLNKREIYLEDLDALDNDLVRVLGSEYGADLSMLGNRSA